MASNDFWTNPNYHPIQQFRFDVQTNLWRADISSAPRGGKITVRERYAMPKELIKAVNLPDTTFGYDNDAANIGSGGPNIESQDPQMAELELQFYLTPESLSTMQDVFHTYYLQQVEKIGNTISGVPARILNRDRISIQPSEFLLENSTIAVNIYNPSPQATRGAPASPIRQINYYGVYPVSYSFGNLDYSNSDVVVGNMKFYFYGHEILGLEEIRRSTGSSSRKQDFYEAISNKEKIKTMGEF